MQKKSIKAQQEKGDIYEKPKMKKVVSDKNKKINVAGYTAFGCCGSGCGCYGCGY